jgi:hypothetical protein
VSTTQFSKWANEVNFGEIYEEYDDNLTNIENAFQAVSDFCRKDKKREKTYKKRKSCWL